MAEPTSAAAVEMTIAQAVVRLGVPVREVCARIDRGELQAIRIGDELGVRLPAP